MKLLTTTTNFSNPHMYPKEFHECNQLLRNTLLRRNFVEVPLALGFLLEYNLAVTVIRMLDKQVYFLDIGKTKEGGWFYWTAESTERELGFSLDQQNQIFKKLEALGFIQKKLFDSPPKRYFRVNSELILEIITKFNPPDPKIPYKQENLNPPDLQEEGRTAYREWEKKKEARGKDLLERKEWKRKTLEELDKRRKNQTMPRDSDNRNFLSPKEGDGPQEKPEKFSEFGQLPKVDSGQLPKHIISNILNQKERINPSDLYTDFSDQTPSGSSPQKSVEEREDSLNANPPGSLDLEENKLSGGLGLTSLKNLKSKILPPPDRSSTLDSTSNISKEGQVELGFRFVPSPEPESFLPGSGEGEEASSGNISLVPFPEPEEVPVPVLSKNQSKKSRTPGLGEEFKRPKKSPVPIKEVPPDVTRIIEHWNSLEELPTLRVNNEKSSQVYRSVVENLDKLFSGKFFGSIPGYEKFNRAYSPREVIQAIDHFYLALTSMLHYPKNKDSLKKIRLGEFLLNPYWQGEVKSPFLQNLEEPKLVAKDEAPIHDDNPGETQRLIDWYKEKFHGSASIPVSFSQRDLNDFITGRQMLDRFFRTHNVMPHSVDDECIWLCDALIARVKQIGPHTLAQDWVYASILSDWLSERQMIYSEGGMSRPQGKWDRQAEARKNGNGYKSKPEPVQEEPILQPEESLPPQGPRVSLVEAQAERRRQEQLKREEEKRKDKEARERSAITKSRIYDPEWNAQYEREKEKRE